jgi:hypothetical protein
MLNHVRKYADIKLFSVYIKKIIEGITVRFKKDKSYNDVAFLSTK